MKQSHAEMIIALLFFIWSSVAENKMTSMGAMFFGIVYSARYVIAKCFNQ